MLSTVRTLSQLTSNWNLKFKFRITKLNLCILIFCFVPILFFGKQAKILAETSKTSCIWPRKTASTYSSKFVCLFVYFSRIVCFPASVTTWWWWCRDALRSFFLLWKVCALHIGSLKGWEILKNSHLYSVDGKRILIFSNKIFARKIISSKSCIIHSAGMKQLKSISVTMQCEFVPTHRQPLVVSVMTVQIIHTG